MVTQMTQLLGVTEPDLWTVFVLLVPFESFFRNVASCRVSYIRNMFSNEASN